MGTGALATEAGVVATGAEAASTAGAVAGTLSTAAGASKSITSLAADNAGFCDCVARTKLFIQKQEWFAGVERNRWDP